MAQDLKTYFCLCGCGMTWKQLHPPNPKDQYAMRSHHPDFPKGGELHTGHAWGEYRIAILRAFLRSNRKDFNQE